MTKGYAALPLEIDVHSPIQVRPPPVPKSRQALLAIVGVVVLLLVSGAFGTWANVSPLRQPRAGAQARLVAAIHPFTVRNHTSSRSARAPGVAQPPPSGESVGEAGYGIGFVHVGSRPEESCFDASNGLVYVPNFLGDNVSLLNGTTLEATVQLPTGAGPEVTAYDSSRGFVYVSDNPNGQVSIINGTTVVANVSVGNNPIGVAYDSANRYTYVGVFTDDKVAVLNGTSVVANVSLGGYAPLYLTYDTATQWVYVATDSGSVEVINGSSVVKSIGVSGFGTGIGYDPQTQVVYYLGGGSGVVQLINGTTVVANTSITGSISIAYDSGNGWMYLTSAGSNIAILNGSKFVQNVQFLGGGQSPGVDGLTYDPWTGDIYASIQNTDNVSVISTVLGVGAPAQSPAGSPSNSSDVGQEREFSLGVWALGNGTLNATYSVRPASSVYCPLAPNLTVTGVHASVTMTCFMESSGNSSLAVSVSDAQGSTVTSSIALRIYPDVVATPVRGSVNATTVTSGDSGETVDFAEVPSGGTGQTVSESWNVSGAGAGCTPPSNASSFACVLPATGTLELQTNVTDSNGLSSMSPPVAFPINPGLFVSEPVASRASADVGQPVQFQVSVTGGSGSYVSFNWTGLSRAACSNLSTPNVTCTFPSSGNYSIGASVEDSTLTAGGPGPALPFRVYGSLVAHVSYDRPAADVGQSLGITAAVSGGLAPFSYSWEGLPAPCVGADTPSPVCTPAAPSDNSVRLVVTDANGAAATASGPVAINVSSALNVSRPAVLNPNLTVGDSLSVSASFAGGAAPYVVSWNGLPAGCPASGPRVVCSVSTTGHFEVSSNVTDANGENGTSVAVDVSVLPTPTPSNAPSSPLVPLVVVAVVLLVAAAVGTSLLLLRRRSRGRSRLADTGP